MMKQLLLSLCTANQSNRTALFFKSILLFFVVLAGWNGQAQVSSNYVNTQVALASYTDLTAAKTVAIGLTWDDNTPVSIPIGFSFNFNGSPYSNTTVSPNGYVTFGATLPTTTNYSPIASAEAYAGAIAVYATNLSVATTAGGTPQPNSVSYELDVTGGVGNRILKIEWRAFRRILTETTLMSMQLWLYETTNVIETRYATQTSNFAVNAVGQIGLRGTTNADFNSLNYTAIGAWPTSPAVIPAATTNAQTVRTRNGAIIIAAGSNRLFRWTPNTCFSPSSLTTSNVLITTADVTFTPPSPVPSGGYQYEIRTSPGNVLVSSGTAPFGSTGFSVSGLSGSTTYVINVRSDCGGPFSPYVSAGIFTTLCSAISVPYYEGFDFGTTVLPALPTCTSQVKVSPPTGNFWFTADLSLDPTANLFFADNGLEYNQSGTQNANVWFFTQGITLTAGQNYRLLYTYGGSSIPSTVVNKMEVKYGLSPTNVGMTIPLDNHPNVKGLPSFNDVNFTAPAAGVYYFGFRAYSDAANGKLFVDDIDLNVATCIPIPPASPVASSIASTSATVNWTIPSTPPAEYVYYISTNPTPPTNNTAPTASTGASPFVNLTGLANNTTYYFWVRGHCTGIDYSAWTNVISFMTLNTPAFCVPSSTVNTSYFSNFSTSGCITNISNITGYALPSGYADYTAQTVTQSAGANIAFTTTIVGPTVGVAIWVDWNINGIFDATERMYNTAAYVSAASGTFAVPGAQANGYYRMRIVMDYWATNPSPCAINNTFGYQRGETEDYTVRVVPPPPALTLSANTSAQCSGTNSPTITLTAGGGAGPTSYSSFVWSPSGGVTGSSVAGWVFNAAATTVYTLTATQSFAPFSINTVKFTYNGASAPTAVTVTPATATVCQSGPALLLTSSGGIVNNSIALIEDFNAVATGWTTINASTGTVTYPDINPPAWTIRPNGYNRGVTYTSNDASGFMLADSDAQGSGTYTDVTLESPVFSLANYTTANLSFWHYYRGYPFSNAYVDISNDGGFTWNTLQTYSNLTVGTSSGFVNVNLDLSAYLIPLGSAQTNTNLKIRFKYTGNWAWYWAVDNVTVKGTLSPQIVWTPITGLYSDAAAAIPYVANTVSTTVYAMPSINTIYTASTSTALCGASNTTNITVTPVVAGTVSGGQTNCDIANLTNLTLAGQVGNIIRWEYSASATFASGIVPIGNTTTTLTPGEFGSFSGIRYFRAVVGTGSCNNVYSNIVSVTIDTTTWNGSGPWSNGTPTASKLAIVQSGTLNIIANLTACTFQVDGGTVTVASGVTLNVQNRVIVNAGSLTFNNNASLIQPSTATTNTNIGSINYLRNTSVRKYDYTYWSTPVGAQTLTNLSPQTLSDKYFYFNTTTYVWTNLPSLSTMMAGLGYLVRAPQPYDPVTPALFTANFIGVPNNGNYVVPIVYTSATQNMNCIGNPYPSALSASLMMSGNTGVFGASGTTLYLWTHNTPLTGNSYAANDMASWNYTGGVGTMAGSSPCAGCNNNVPNGNIASGQAFVIKALASGNATFRNSMRLTGSNNQFFRQSDAETNPMDALERNRIWLELKSTEGAYKQILVGYIQNATNNIEEGFDGEILEAGNPISLYSIAEDKKLSLQGRSLPFDSADLVPLGFKTNVAGTYEINMSDFDGLFTDSSVGIYLEDTLLNVIHDLRSGSYSFVTESGVFDTRFVLRYTNNLLGVAPLGFNDNGVVVYKQNADIHIQTSNIILQSVQIFDVRGRLILEQKNINQSSAVFANLSMAHQVLVVQITAVDGTTVSKKIIF